MPEYIPPAFPIVELLAPGAALSDRRSLHHWNGQVGSPAAEVVLEWVDGRSGALVSSTADPRASHSERQDDEEGRRNAVRLWLLSPDLELRVRSQVEPGVTHRRMRQLAAESDKWRPVRLLIDSTPLGAYFRPLSTRVTIGYFRLSAVVVVSFSMWGINERELQFRTVSKVLAEAYDANPLQPSELS